MHIPVLSEEVMDLLNVKENGTYVDATVGLGGHSAAILSMLGSEGRLVGLDRDEAALRQAAERLGNGRVRLGKANFSAVGSLLSSLDIKEVDGILFDLGVSMLQLKEPERGFSFNSDERLDMRMDPAQRLTAWDIVNRYTEKEISRILWEYGEETRSRRIAASIAAHRKKTGIDTCVELADLVSAVYGGRGRVHPATRTFQALRIEVNRELDELKEGLSVSLNVLKRGGRLCVISYHSLEDRIVKNFIRDNARNGALKILTRKPVAPGVEEIRKNPSSRSAKLRGAERT